jgi:hypothetical protein
MIIKEISMDIGFGMMVAAAWMIAAGVVYWAIKEKS